MGHSGVDKELSTADLSLLEAGGVSSSEPPLGKKRKRGKGSKRRRGGVEQHERRAGVSDAKNRRLRKRAAYQGQVLRSSKFSIAADALRTSTGWHGQSPPIKTQGEIIKLYKNGRILPLLAEFFPVHYEVLSK